MKKALLVADSGGTQTDWCYVDSLGDRHFFTTSSFHPSNWNEDFFKEFAAFWDLKPEMKKAEVHFYGAGCLQETNKKRIGTYFSEWGFTNYHIFSDVEGACRALLGNEAGVVAILGTGSVACEFDGEKITSIHGGLGYLLGDEGSGYYFGKMLLSSLLNNQFDAELSVKLYGLLGDKGEILKQVYGNEGKKYISSIPKLTNSLKQGNEVLQNLHKNNFELFLNNCFSDVCVDGVSLGVVGSYGYHNVVELTETLHKNNKELKIVLQYPINSLTDYTQKQTF